MARRALLILPDYAYSPDTGGGQRSALFFEALSKSYDVDLLIVAEYAPPGFFKDIYGAKNFRQENLAQAGKRGFWRYLHPLNNNFIDRLAAATASRKAVYAAAASIKPDFAAYDLVVARYLKTASRAGALAADVPLLIDIDDRDDYVVRKRLEEPDINPLLRLLLKRQQHELEKLFPRYVQRADHLWFVTAGDFDDLDHPSMSVVPNIPYVDEARQALPPADPENKTLLFVGSAEHRPNFRGISRFIQSSWPRILSAMPDARLRIVGRGDWSRQMPIFNAAANVDFIGEVGDLACEYAKANVVVSPVYEGGGSKIKVVEAYAFNRAVVAARHSVRGLEALFKAGAIMAADDDAELAKQCMDLLCDPAKAQQMAERGRTVVATHYNRAAFAQQVLDDCETVIGKTAASNGAAS